MAQAAPDKSRIQAVKGWIEAVGGQKVGNDIFEELKDGVILCDTINKIKPGTCKKYKASSVPFVCRQNIEIFLNGCKALGVAQNDLFETRDLFDGQRPESVLMTIEALSVVAEDKHKVGSAVGPKRAQQNVRQFTEEQLNKSKSAVPLLSQGDKQNDTSSKHDSYGIIKNKDVTRHSGVQSKWEQGSLATDTSSKHDSYGIIKNPDVTKHTGVQSKWEQGSLATDTSSKHDSYGIIKNKDVTKHTGVQSKWEQGSIATDTSSNHDSYGIIKNKDMTKHTGVQSKWEQGSLATDSSSKHDSYGIIQQPDHLKK